jgi:ABC-2 type transport system permease protein
MNLHRITALLSKELADLSRNRAAFLPVLIVSGISLALPFVVALLIPAVMGEPLTGDPDFDRAVSAASRYVSAFRRLPPESAMQAFLFQQFLLFFLLIPITGAMSLAAHSVVGEKIARTLEPLLATPITAAELLTTKVIAAALPTIAVMILSFSLYLALIGALAAPGVFQATASVRSFGIILLLGPLAALVALMMAVIVSSRVNDPRTAQQVGVLLILPIVGILVAQFAGLFWLTVPLIFAIALVLATSFALLLVIGVELFDREAILTKWK